MYYNMRVRTAQRNLAEAQLRLTERKKTMLQLPEECIRTITQATKNVCTNLEHLFIYIYNYFCKLLNCLNLPILLLCKVK